MPRTTYGLSPGAAARLFNAVAHEVRVGLVLLLAERGRGGGPL